MKRLTKNKKGQLFIIEAFIAVSVMIIMVTALYEVQLATQPSSEPNFQDDVYNTLKLLDKNGILDEYIVTVETGSAVEIAKIKNTIKQSVYGILPDNGEFQLFCENMASSNVVSNSWINQALILPKESIGIDYLIAEINGEFESYVYHFQVWLKGV
ncbi:MAG: hypothetical protein H7645_01725 [Candidatus Heimdallarchaeota archaeon]|nr:hypothetical protein [Candidatus Heimdallarchaeota archaeon]MCK4769036.1 hypothetical protein [Candidatus Heimdallarchaeota archaeon]